VLRGEYDQSIARVDASFGACASRSAGVLVLALATAACGRQRARSAQGFISFCQPASSIKRACCAFACRYEKFLLGAYYDQYMLIADFNRRNERHTDRPYKNCATSAPRTVQELIARRADVKAWPRR